MICNLNRGLIINEAGFNFGEESYIELVSIQFEDADDSGMVDENAPNIAIVIIEPHRDKRRRTKMVAAIDISHIIEYPFVSSKYYVVGNPSSEWVEIPAPADQGLPLPASSYARLYGNPREWMNVATQSLKAVILLKSDQINIKDIWPDEASPFIDQNPEFAEYLLENQIDVLLATDFNGNRRSCAVIDDYVTNLNTNTMKPRYLTVPRASTENNTVKQISINRCGGSFQPFNHREFDPVPPSPFAENKCVNLVQFNQAAQLQSFIAPTISSRESEVCGHGQDSPEDVDMTTLSGEHLSREAQMEAIDAAATSSMDEGFCAYNGSTTTTQANVFAKLRRLELHAARLQNGVAVVTEEALASKDHKKPESFTKAMTFIETHLNKSFNMAELEDFSEWFSIIENSTHPLQSKLICSICSKKSKDYAIKEQSNLGNPHGEPVSFHRYENMRQIRSHAKLLGHGTAMDFWRDEQEANHHKAFSALHSTGSKLQRVTLRNFRTAFTEATEDLAFRKHGPLVDMQTVNGLPMGTQCTSEWTSKRMIHLMGEIEFEDFKASLLASRSPFALICDGSSGIYLH